MPLRNGDIRKAEEYCWDITQALVGNEDSKIEKIIEELKEIYNIMFSSRNTEEVISNSKKCNEIIQNRIKKNLDYYIRVS